MDTDCKAEEERGRESEYHQNALYDILESVTIFFKDLTVSILPDVKGRASTY